MNIDDNEMEFLKQLDYTPKIDRPVKKMPVFFKILLWVVAIGSTILVLIRSVFK
ncbi:MAG: hypothetical protein QM763_03215 [Agriterribacter sp.]